MLFYFAYDDTSYRTICNCVSGFAPFSIRRLDFTFFVANSFSPKRRSERLRFLESSKKTVETRYLATRVNKWLANLLRPLEFLQPSKRVLSNQRPKQRCKYMILACPISFFIFSLKRNRYTIFVLRLIYRIYERYFSTSLVMFI